jgi:hypothetical protein
VTSSTGIPARGLLDANLLHAPEAAHPLDQRAIALARGRERALAQHLTGDVDDGGEVQILVRVDAADDLLVDAWHAEHRWLPSELGRGSAWRSSDGGGHDSDGASGQALMRSHRRRGERLCG